MKRWGWRKRVGRRTMRRRAWTVVAVVMGIAGLAGVSAGASAAPAATIGGGWNLVFHAPKYVDLLDISCPTRQACVVSAGAGRYQPAGAMFVTLDGGRVWKEEDVPSPRHRPLLGVACARGTLSCEAVGNDYDEGFTPPVGALTDTTNGTTWQRQFSPGGYLYFDAAACPAKGVCEAVGEAAGASGPAPIIRTTDGGKVWDRQGSSRVSDAVYDAVSCPSVKVCVAGGPDGVIYTHDAGARWWFIDEPAKWYLHVVGVACGSAEDCVAVGTEGYAGGRNLLMYSTDGGVHWIRWKVPSVIDQGVNNVACPTASCCVVTGEGGTIVTTDGGRTWSVQSVLDGADGLNAIACTRTTTCYALGSGGQDVLVHAS